MSEFRYRHKMWIKLDNYRRRLFVKYEWQRRFLKIIIKNPTISYHSRYRASYYLSSFPIIATRTRMKNRCVISGRSWSNNKRINTCRFTFRREINAANLPGLSRASW